MICETMCRFLQTNTYPEYVAFYLVDKQLQKQLAQAMSRVTVDKLAKCVIVLNVECQVYDTFVDLLYLSTWTPPVWLPSWQYLSWESIRHWVVFFGVMKVFLLREISLHPHLHPTRSPPYSCTTHNFEFSVNTARSLLTRQEFAQAQRQFPTSRIVSSDRTILLATRMPPPEE